jgi:hypothetical protein
MKRNLYSSATFVFRGGSKVAERGTCHPCHHHLPFNKGEGVTAVGGCSKKVAATSPPAFLRADSRALRLAFTLRGSSFLAAL